MKVNNPRFERMIPYLMLGVALVVVVAVAILMFYLFVWGVLIGLLIWGIMAIKEKFFSTSPSVHVNKEKEGRIIDIEIEPSTSHSKNKKQENK